MAQTPATVRKPDTSPTFAIGGGYAIVAIGVLLTMADGLFAVAGMLVVALGGLFAMIGTVAAGVQLGLRWVDYDRSRRG